MLYDHRFQANLKDRHRASFADVVKGFTKRRQTSRLTCIVLPAADCDVDIMRIELDRPGTSTGLFGCDQDRSAATKGVKHKTAAL